ncbi:MAG: hypothetical protein J5685_08165 [Clostridiales bacterium]|nr:hypothetical protein [Clostridiales bacterium]
MGLFGSKKKGYWIKEERLFRSDSYVCSVCKKRFSKASSTCPSCGAVMTKTKNDPGWVDDLEMIDAIFDD